MELQAIADRQQKFVRVAKGRIIDTLRVNRAKHQKDWEKAMAGWKTAMIKALEEHAAKCSEAMRQMADSSFEDNPDLPYPDYPRKPTNYVARYDEILERLDFELDNEIHLTHEDFNRYVRDNWEWKAGFEAMSMAYK